MVEITTKYQHLMPKLKSPLSKRFLQICEEIINTYPLKSQGEFLEDIGAGSSAVSQIRRGRQDVTAIMLYNLRKKYNVDINKMIDGENPLPGVVFIPKEDIINRTTELVKDIVDFTGFDSVRQFLLSENIPDSTWTMFRGGKFGDTVPENLLSVILKHGGSPLYIYFGAGEKFIKQSDKELLRQKDEIIAQQAALLRSYEDQISRLRS